MARFIVLSKFNSEGQQQLAKTRQLGALKAEVEALHGKLVEQYCLLGSFDVFSIVDVPDGEAAHLMTAGALTKRTIIPAIDMKLFTRLLGQTTETTGPHRWQISLPARIGRRLLRKQTFTGDVARWCKPYTVLGAENFEGLKGPAVFIANHASHLDSSALYCALPKRYQRRVAFGAAADRFYIKGRKGIKKQGWWFSLSSNSFPIKRGAGRSSLAHGEWLLEKKWSIVIFPEGARSSSGRLARFRVGPALLALAKDVPVVPMFMEGLAAIRPRGQKARHVGAVTIRVGAPLRFPPGTDPTTATKAMEHAIDALRIEAKAARPPRPILEPVAAPTLVPSGLSLG